MEYSEFSNLINSLGKKLIKASKDINLKLQEGVEVDSIVYDVFDLISDFTEQTEDL